MTIARHMLQLLLLLISIVGEMSGQTSAMVDVRMRLSFPNAEARRAALSAVVWLKPLQETPPAPFVPEHHYTLLQKNRMFKPHLLIIPVGSVVQFPNADPFFHNVFSLFDGKRFDLGLYEAGSSKFVTFSREGVSYIFCNIHPEMSAVILTLSTTLYDAADRSGAFHLANVPAGDYELHIWIEGVGQADLNQMTRRVHLAPGSGDLGFVPVPAAFLRTPAHTNMYGQPYDHEAKPTY
jgi:plastocyanin